MGSCVSTAVAPEDCVRDVSTSVSTPRSWTNRNYSWLAEAIRKQPVEHVIRELILSRPPPNCILSKCSFEQVNEAMHCLLKHTKQFKELTITHFPEPLKTNHICVSRTLAHFENRILQEDYNDMYLSKHLQRHGFKKKKFIKFWTMHCRRNKWHGFNDLSVAEFNSVRGQMLNSKKKIVKTFKKKYSKNVKTSTRKSKLKKKKSKSSRTKFRKERSTQSEHSVEDSFDGDNDPADDEISDDAEASGDAEALGDDDTSSDDDSEDGNDSSAEESSSDEDDSSSSDESSGGDESFGGGDSSGGNDSYGGGDDGS